ncbi:MAG: diguanylate cyclase [Campylobacterales bacterium]
MTGITVEFPSVESIATRDVAWLPESASIQEAVGMMKRRGLRDLIVAAGEDYRLICADDLIRLRLEGVGFDRPLGAVTLPRVQKLHHKASVLDALGMGENESDYLCLTDDEGALCGIVSYSDLVAKIDPDRVVENMTLQELLPGSAPTVASAHSPTLQVLEQMQKEGSDAVLIQTGDRLSGILTQKDAIDLFEQGKALDQPVSAHMSAPLLSVPKTMRVWEAYEYLRHHRFKRLVITAEDGTLAGIITQRDLVAKSYNRRMALLHYHEQKVRETGRLLSQELEQIKTVGTVDPLTGLFNRQIFNELLRREIARAKRHGDPLSLLVLDIDHFKRVNDTFGHLAGDRVLEGLAKELTATLRTSDLLSRWGGEEFAVLLPHTDCEGARQAAEKLRQAVETCEFEGPGRITISIGAATWQTGEEMDAFFDRADRALYEAKKQGRNRVCSLEAQPGKIDEVGHIVGHHGGVDRAGLDHAERR